MKVQFIHFIDYESFCWEKHTLTDNVFTDKEVVETVPATKDAKRREVDQGDDVKVPGEKLINDETGVIGAVRPRIVQLATTQITS